MNFNLLKKGIVKVEIQVFNREQLLNVLWNKGIKIRNIRKRNISTIIMEIDYNDLEVVKDVVNRLNGRLIVLSKNGAVFVIKGMKRKVSFVVGCFIFIGLIFYLSKFIWRIEVYTKKYVSPFEVRETLKNLGVTQGMKKNELNVYDLEKKIESANQSIMWVNARIEGSTLKVKLEEKITPPAIDKEADEVSNVVAGMDGEIRKIYTTSGTAVVKAGDIVKKGQELISTTEGREGFEFDVPAKGKVLANTFYEKIVEVKVNGTVEERTGETVNETYLTFGDKKIYLKKPTKTFENYDKIEDIGKFIHKNTYYEKTLNEMTVDREKVINDTVQVLYNATLKEISKQATIVDKIVNTEDIGDGKVKLKATFVVEQDIALNY